MKFFAHPISLLNIDSLISLWGKTRVFDRNQPEYCLQYCSLIFTADALDVTSEPDEANLAIASANSLTQAHPPSKFAQLEVELGGSVTLQCPQGELWDFTGLFFKGI